jgi:hypothetical protein
LTRETLVGVLLILLIPTFPSFFSFLIFIYSNHSVGGWETGPNPVVLLRCVVLWNCFRVVFS